MEMEIPTKTNSDSSSQPDLKYWLAFSRLKKIGPKRMSRLLEYFNYDLKSAWESDSVQMSSAGLEENLVQEIIVLRPDINPEEELEKLIKNGVQAVTLVSPSYPALLKEIYDPPFILYYRGSLDPLKTNPLGVVGARKYSTYGRQTVEELVSDLSRQGLTIVSGLALGIDALAHEATLASNGKTIAVLGSGLDWPNIYPSANRYLAKKIIDAGGAIISEYPIGTPPLKQHFPQRNRIIAGLSLGTLVIEAAEHSGSLITAHYSLEYNREVFAVPGSIYQKNSLGTNKLIKRGAKMVTTAADVFEELNLLSLMDLKTEKITIELTEEEQLIIKILSQEPLHIDKISQMCNTKINVLAGTLMLLEMKGLIKDLGGKNYIVKQTSKL